MKYTPKSVKNALKKTISDIEKRKEYFVKDPQKDFRRIRKLPFSEMIYSILSLSSKALKCELMDSYGFHSNIPSVSAFVQQRGKMSYTAFETIFKTFTAKTKEQKLYKGYTLLAVDGSDLHTPTNPNDTDSYYPGTNGKKPYNLMHLNVLYDLMSNTYVDAIVQASHNANEHNAFVTMVDRYNSKVPAIYIADRGYEAYNNLAHIQEKGRNFLIRIKDISGKGIASAVDLPKTDEYDVSLQIQLTRKQTNAVKMDNTLRFIPHNSRFDYLPAHSEKCISITPYIIPCRLVRLKISDDTYEMLITNLKSDVFSPADLKKLYAMRWGIETSFRTLKYTLGLIYFHSKKAEFILQEIFAKLTMYNFAELITSHVVIRQKKRKCLYKVNFSASIHICAKFLLKYMSPPEVEALISRYLVPIRQCTSNSRKLSPKTAVSFLYRIA